MDFKKFIEMCIEISQEKSITMSQEDKEYFKAAVERLGDDGQ